MQESDTHRICDPESRMTWEVENLFYLKWQNSLDTGRRKEIFKHSQEIRKYKAQINVGWKS